jgi:putative peptide zinc metalloprotease protein
MADYQITDGSIIRFHELYRGEEGGLILVGRRDIGSYVSLPPEAVEVIDLLDSGKAVGEVKKILEEKYKEEAEVEAFLDDMISNEMVKYVDGYKIPTTSPVQKDLFTSITKNHVGWLFSRYAWLIYIGMGTACLAIFALFPQYIPTPIDFFFHPWYSVAVGLMFFCGWVLVAVHELAHLFAARSVGTEGYFSLSNKLIFIVAQTNLGNIWTVSRKKRYIVYFAGIAWDSVMVFICLVLLIASDQGIIGLSTLWYRFLKAVTFIKVWGIIWQFRFNMQTDIYYAVANYFKCRNLLSDAQAYIKNSLSRFCSRIGEVDLSGTPEYEMKAIKWYSVLYFVGTSLTLATYFFRTMPILLLQIRKAFNGIMAGYAVNHADFMDAVILIVLTTFNFGLLGFLILRPRWDSLKQRFHAPSALMKNRSNCKQ